MRAKINRSSNGKHYVNLIARNGRIVFTSEMYERKGGAENAIAVLEREGLKVERVED